MRRFAFFIAAIAIVTLSETDAECGRKYANMKSGVLRYNSLSNESRCKWTIEVQSNYVMKLTFNIVKQGKRKKPYCSKNDVMVYDVLSNIKRLLRQKVCTTYFGTLTSSSSIVEIEYKHGQRNKLDFSISWEIVDITMSLAAKPKHTVLAGKYGKLSSPRYPFPYPNGLHKKWEIIVPFGKNIRLQFDNFHLDTRDYVEIFDITYTNEMISTGRWYGSKSPPIIKSAGTRLFVEFNSDGIATKGSGFHAIWNTLSSCGGNFTTSSGLLSSPNYPSLAYGYRSRCRWIIDVSDGYVIRLNFLPILVPSKSHKLKVYGINPRGKIVLYDSKKLEMDHIDRPIISSSSTIEVEVINKGYSGKGIGFSAHWEKAAVKACETEDGMCTCDTGYTKQEARCVAVKACETENGTCTCDTGYTKQEARCVAVKACETEDGMCTCDTGYTKQEARCVDINECVYNNGGCDQVCTNEVGSWKCSCHSGFNASGPMCITPSCSETFNDPEGFFGSLNYPIKYPVNTYCRWEINPRHEPLITLYFKPVFDLEDDIDCARDYVQVIRGDDVLGKWCGNNRPPNLTSNGGKMVVIFKSDKSNGGKGFFVSWTWAA